MTEPLRILAVIGLVAANAFFVTGEYALVTARRGALRRRADAGSRGARTALLLMDDPVQVISTVQVGITAIGILTGAIGEPIVRDLLGDGIPAWLGFAIAFGAVTYLSVVFGELVPKAVTLERSERMATVVARPVRAFSIAFRPAVWLLQRSATILLRPLGIREIVAGERIRSTEELRALVDEVEGAGVLPRAQEELLHRVFDFADLEVADVMVPAHDVAWLDAGLTAAEALDRVVEAPHERYPVGRGSLSRLIGVIHVHDLVAVARERPSATVGDLARPAFVVPETKDVGALLREQRERRQQLAIVVDEYGTTVGVVSVEDILEEIVGEIEGEYDLPDATLTWDGDRKVQAVGSITIDDFNEEVGTRFPRRNPRTMAGLLFDALGRRPRPGDTVTMDGAQIRVEAMDGLRISRLSVTLPAEDAEEAGE